MGGGLTAGPAQLKAIVGGVPTIDLVGQYGVSTGASSAANAHAIMKAWSDSLGLMPSYLRAGRYPCDPLTVPNFPIYMYGDGRSLSVLVYPQSIPYALTYDNSNAGHIQPSSPWYTITSNGANSNHAWAFRGMGFEGGDWNGSTVTNAAIYFPQWVDITPPTGRTAMALRMWDVSVGLFQGNGFLCEINGLFGDCVFSDLDVYANSLDGVIPGSDSRYVNLMTHSNGGWGLKPDDHRILQIVGGKSYGNGQVDHTAGGYYIRGSMDTLNNLYAQDNNGPGYQIDGATLVSMGQLVADRNCVNGTDHSGMVINNCHGVIIDGYLATDSQRLNCQIHALKVTGTNTDCVVRGTQQVTGPDPLSTFVESNSGGCTVYTPV